MEDKVLTIEESLEELEKNDDWKVLTKDEKDFIIGLAEGGKTAENAIDSALFELEIEGMHTFNNFLRELGTVLAGRIRMDMSCDLDNAMTSMLDNHPDYEG